ncbi:MAG: DUF1320 domain-containing protein [Magnetococcales bacterium]|nr:DUF1320 domain-containing protein [Magnetococcales bacterium]
MSYATPQNLLDWYGAKELAQIATPDDLPLVSAPLLRLAIQGEDLSGFSAEEQSAAQAALTRMVSALDAASHLMDSYLNRRYPLPIATPEIANSPLPQACGRLSRHLLYDDGIPFEVEQRYKQTISWLQELAGGQVQIPALLPPAFPSGVGLADAKPSTRIFDAASLAGFIGHE